jgi:branched-chain amino acid transport system ATP-binding protein
VTAALLELTGVDAWYGQVQVLRDVHLSVREGEKVTVLGPNGAGKTTLLRAVSRMVRTAGGLSLAGVDLARQDTAGVAALGVAHVPTGRGTFTDLSVLDNLRLGLTARTTRVRRTDELREIDAVLAAFPGLVEHLNRRAGQLSGGQQQLLALARALLGRPRLVLVDEPSQGLAPLVVRELFATLRRLQDEWGTALLLAEQNSRLSLDLADRAYVLAGGRCVLDGPAKEISMDDLHQAYLGAGASAS